MRRARTLRTFSPSLYSFTSLSSSLFGKSHTAVVSGCTGLTSLAHSKACDQGRKLQGTSLQVAKTSLSDQGQDGVELGPVQKPVFGVSSSSPSVDGSQSWQDQVFTLSHSGLIVDIPDRHTRIRREATNHSSYVLMQTVLCPCFSLAKCPENGVSRTLDRRTVVNPGYVQVFSWLSRIWSPAGIEKHEHGRHA